MERKGRNQWGWKLSSFHIKLKVTSSRFGRKGKCSYLFPSVRLLMHWLRCVWLKYTISLQLSCQFPSLFPPEWSPHLHMSVSLSPGFPWWKFCYRNWVKNLGESSSHFTAEHVTGSHPSVTLRRQQNKIDPEGPKENLTNFLIPGTFKKIKKVYISLFSFDRCLPKSWYLFLKSCRVENLTLLQNIQK